jgi:hypothetical protein
MKVVSTDSQKFNAVVRVGGDWTCVVALDQLSKHFDFLEDNRNESTSGYKSLLDVIPLRGQHTEKPSIATVTHGDVNDLRWSTVQQRSIVEVRVFTEDNQTLRSPALPNLCVGGSQQIAIKRCSASCRCDLNQTHSVAGD